MGGGQTAGDRGGGGVRPPGSQDNPTDYVFTHTIFTLAEVPKGQGGASRRCTLWAGVAIAPIFPFAPKKGTAWFPTLKVR